MKDLFTLFVLVVTVAVNTNAQLVVPCGTQSVYWSDDFEGVVPNWSADNGVWQTGVPLSGPSSSHSGTNCAATNLSGNYTAGSSSRLINNISVTIPPAIQNPRLRFWQWYSYATMAGTDYGRVQIRTSLNPVWSNLTTYTYIATGSGVWSREEIDLTPYADSTVQFGFLMKDVVAGGYYQSSGWYIDDVEIITGPYININSEGFENGWNDWSSEGTWEIGVPAVGPTGACNGSTQCAGTNLNGNYEPSCTGHLKSPWIKLPPASQTPSISFCYWFSFASTAGGDYGKLQFRTKYSGWKDTATYSGTSSVWSNAFFNMSAYGDSVVQFGFLMQDIVAGGYYQSSGWYIDNVYINGLPDTSCFYLNGNVGIVDYNDTKDKVNIYPNPANNFINIEFLSVIKGGTLAIYNALGTKIFEEPIIYESKKKINLNNNPSGIYFVKVFDGEKYVCRKVTIVQN